MSQPFYHLRPNKYVDRALFIKCLEQLSRTINIKSHRYIGFGSYTFDDFKQIHDKLDISTMISLESDPIVFKRAQYNIPYKCIKIVNQTSTDYIAGGDWNNKKNIIWLDYTDPSELAKQFNDIAALSNIVEKNDIIRVTFNAHVSSLGTPHNTKSDGSKLSIQEYRFKKLKERIGEYIPADIEAADIVTSQYPIVILSSLKKMIQNLFMETQFDKRFLLPLFATIYKDGQTMVTFTGIVLEDHEQEEKIKTSFKKIPYVNFVWDNPSIIDIPNLTVKEMLEINKLLPSKSAQKQIEKKFNFVFKDTQREIESYISFYKYYPNFHNVNF